MRLLADENSPLPTIESLREAGHNVAWARLDAPGARDTDLLETAEAEGRIVLTLDKDFWQIAVQRRHPLARSGVILFRVHPAIPDFITPLAVRTLSAGTDLLGHATVVTPERMLRVELGERHQR